MILGGLTESPFFDYDRGNDTRSLSGVLVTFRPAIDTGLTLGLSRLVMANAVGVKIGDRETRDIVDIWALMPDEFDALAYADPAAGARDYKNLPEAESLAAARNREAYARAVAFWEANANWRG